MIFEENLFPDCSFYCSEILSLLMTSPLTRKNFTSLNYNIELIFFVKMITQKDQFGLEEKEIIMNCLDILSFSMLEEQNCENIVSERYFDMIVDLLKAKKFFSAKALELLHSISSLPFEGFDIYFYDFNVYIILDYFPILSDIKLFKKFYVYFLN